jgi:hypothetical protein
MNIVKLTWLNKNLFASSESEPKVFNTFEISDGSGGWLTFQIPDGSGGWLDFEI